MKRKEPTCEIQESTTNNNELFDESFNELLFKLSKQNLKKKNKMSNTVNMIDKYKQFYMMKMLNIDLMISIQYYQMKLMTNFYCQINRLFKTNRICGKNKQFDFNQSCCQIQKYFFTQ